MRLHDVTPRWGYMILTMFPRLTPGGSKSRPFWTPPVRVGASSGWFFSTFNCTRFSATLIVSSQAIALGGAMAGVGFCHMFSSLGTAKTTHLQEFS
jgi:hypothetical protein